MPATRFPKYVATPNPMSRATTNAVSSIGVGILFGFRMAFSSPRIGTSYRRYVCVCTAGRFAQAWDSWCVKGIQAGRDDVECLGDGVGQ